MFRLLIADDEPIERSTLALIVSRCFDNIEVIGEASNGREAIDKAMELKPDILVMDIKMPGINGVMAAKAIKASNSHIKIILVTAYDYYDYVIDSLKSGIDDFLLKPVLKEDLETSLKNITHKIEVKEARKQLEKKFTLKLRELSAFLEQELLATILLNPDASQIESYFSMLDIRFDQACGMLISINETLSPVNIPDSAKKKVYYKRAYGKVLKALEGMGIKFVAAELNSFLYVLLLMYGVESDYNRKLFTLHLVDKIKIHLKNEMGISLYAGIGNTCSSVDKLYDSFSEAKIAHDHSLDAAYETHFSEINLELKYLRYPFSEEKKLCDNVITGHLEEATTSLAILVTWVVTNCHSIKEIHEKLFEILVMVTRATAVFEHIDTKLLNTSQYWEEIKSLKSVNDIYTYMQRVIREILCGINSVRNMNMNMNEQISLAAEYIENNYKNNIRLDDVAKAVSLSPYYLSKLFKSVTGENFIDYLTRYRLSLAESLLREGVFNIREICFRVGYNDPNYFSRLFKKYYHANPNEYKNNLKK